MVHAFLMIQWRIQNMRDKNDMKEGTRVKKNIYKYIPHRGKKN